MAMVYTRTAINIILWQDCSLMQLTKNVNLKILDAEAEEIEAEKKAKIDSGVNAGEFVS